MADPSSRCLRCAELLAPESVHGLLQTQGLDIRQQLEAGVRYLDFRVSMDDNGAAHIGYPCRGAPLESTLDDVRTFLDTYPSEIVILHFKELHGLRTDQYQDLARHILAVYEGLLAPPDAMGGRVTVGALRNSGRRAIVIYPDVYEAAIACALCSSPLGTTDTSATHLRDDLLSAVWPGALVRSVESRATTIEQLKGHIKTELKARSAEQLLVIDATIRIDLATITSGQTGQTVLFFKDGEDVLSRCLPGFLRQAIPRFWRDCFPQALANARLVHSTLKSVASDQVTPEVVKWLQDTTNDTTPNVVAVDWFQGSGFIDTMVEQNASRTRGVGATIC